MKHGDSARKLIVSAVAGFTNDEIFAAAKRGVAAAVKRHKELGRSIVVWREGKVVWLMPEEIEI